MQRKNKQLVALLALVLANVPLYYSGLSVDVMGGVPMEAFLPYVP
jgi:hypothetical protein